MRHPDYDKAFHDTPDYIRSAIELGIRKGEKKMKMRQKFMSALAVAAAFLVILGAAALGASRLAAPKPDNRVASQPRAMATAGGTGGPAAVVTPEVTATPDPTPEDTPTPTPAPTSEPEFPETVYYTQGGRYFHIERECSGLENGIEGNVNDAYHAGKEPCPVCLAGWSFEVNAVPEVTPEPEITPEPTPLPTAAAEAEAEAAEAGEVEVEAAEAGEVEVEAAEAGEVEVEAEEFEYAYLGLAPEDPAYCAPGDNRFHFNPNCPELEGRVTVVTTLGAAMRDHMVCEECKPMEAAVVYSSEEDVMRSAATGDILVYYNPNGTYFHVKYDCSGMQDAQLHTLQEAIEARKFHCPACIGESEKLYWLPVPEADGDSVYTSPCSGCYHRNGDCFHLPSVAVETYGAVKADGALAPCPHCLPELAGAFDSPLCYAGDGDPFYHASPNCERLSGTTLADLSVLQAQAEGRLRCPDCAVEDAAQVEHGETFVKLFGGWLDAAYPGWIFERADVRMDDSAVWYVSTGEDVTPNPRCACVVTEGPSGAVTFALGGASMGDVLISHDFLNALPEAILAACERDALDTLRSAMETADEARASEAFDSVSAIRIEADADGEIAAFELEFCEPGDGVPYGAVALRWQRADGGFELCAVDAPADA